MRGLAAKLTYANVMSTLAVFVVMGGGAYAASTIANNSVGASQLKANAVNSSKVKNGTLLAEDFKAGQLPAGLQGATGATGAAGPAGPAGAAGAAGAKGDPGDPTAPAVSGDVYTGQLSAVLPAAEVVHSHGRHLPASPSGGRGHAVCRLPRGSGSRRQLSGNRDGRRRRSHLRLQLQLLHRDLRLRRWRRPEPTSGLASRSTCSTRPRAGTSSPTGRTRCPDRSAPTTRSPAGRRKLQVAWERSSATRHRPGCRCVSPEAADQQCPRSAS